MKKLFASKYDWLVVLVAIVVLNLLAGQFRLRYDATSEKNYSLSAATKSLLKNLEEPVTIDVLMKGQFPAVFRKLQLSTEDLLKEMKEYAGPQLQFRFIEMEEFLPAAERTRLAAEYMNQMRLMGYNVDSMQQVPGFVKNLEDQILNDSIKALGIQPYNLQVQQKEGEEQIQRSLLPAAILKTGNRVVAIDLLSGKTEYHRDALSGRMELDEAGSIANAEALLEFKLADAIEKIQRKQKPFIGYLVGNGQPMGPETFDLVQTVEKDYQFQLLDPNKNPVIPKLFAAVMIVKPSVPFSDSVKMKIDQYVMQGGKVLWFVDMLYAEKDSLALVAQTLAYDRGLNLDDLLFRYGVRINRDLLQDQQCDFSKMVVGNAGDQPQLADVPFNYYPLLNPSPLHPVTKNLEPVLGQFVNTLDTVKAPGIRKQFLLFSSENAKTVSTPAIISLQELKTIENPDLYKQKHLPVGVLLEGVFTSMYGNRASGEMRSYFQTHYGSFAAACIQPTQQLVVADGDLVLNGYTQKEPFAMGFSRTQEHTYANRIFLTNTLDYMTGNAGIVALRNKEVAVRLLNKSKLEEDRLFWQLLNLASPVVLVILTALLFQYRRKQQYGRPIR
jgi:gliding-associated putative ABC transporter substrate-binding component GldG